MTTVGPGLGAVSESRVPKVTQCVSEATRSQFTGAYPRMLIGTFGRRF
jgi:hypothetical protein